MVPIIERAFALASSGRCLTMQDLGKALRDEGYANVDAHLRGSSIRKQLLQLIAEGRRARSDQ